LGPQSAAEQFAFGGDGTVPISTGSSFFDGCDWSVLEAGEELTVRPDIMSVNISGTVFDVDYWVVYCGPGGFDAYAFYEQNTLPPTPLLADMVADAYQRTPVVAFNPYTSPDGDDEIFIVARTEMFLWVDEEAWDTSVQATATIPLVTVITEATPSLARWSNGEDTIECDGDDMRPYIFGIGGADAQPSNCSLVFKRSSALQTNVVELEVVWSVAWTCTAPSLCGGGGPLPSITTVSEREVVVGEIVAVSN
jgi:hypothetical protein